MALVGLFGDISRSKPHPPIHLLSIHLSTHHASILTPTIHPPIHLLSIHLYTHHASILTPTIHPPIHPLSIHLYNHHASTHSPIIYPTIHPPFSYNSPTIHPQFTHHSPTIHPSCIPPFIKHSPSHSPKHAPFRSGINFIACTTVLIISNLTRSSAVATIE